MPRLLVVLCVFLGDLDRNAERFDDLAGRGGDSGRSHDRGDRSNIAPHRTFAANAPTFSSLQLSVGRLTVHDLDGLERPPVEMVLSACDSGSAAPIGAYEALGLVSTLLAMGTSTVLASVVPVNDRATIGVMRDVHDVVWRGGRTLAEGSAGRSPGRKRAPAVSGDRCRLHRLGA